MKENKNPSMGANESKIFWLRNKLGMVVAIPIIGVTVLITLIQLFKVEVTENLGNIGKSLIPISSTGIGAVLVFYFSKMNLNASTKSCQNVIEIISCEDKIARLSVKNSMIPLDEIIILNYEKDKTIDLKIIPDYEQFMPYYRFAVLDRDNVIKGMIPRGTFYEFMHKQNSISPKTDIELTLVDLLNATDINIKDTFSLGFGFVNLDTTILDAERIVESIDECQNVFITQNGNLHEAVLELLTNNKILELAKV